MDTTKANSPSIHLPLNLLFISPGNVRKTRPATSNGIESMAAMLEAQGQLNALHVTAEIVNGEPTGRFAVEAGSRRLRGLQLLASKGKIAADHAVECKVIEAANALEVSLTENVSQHKMHPSDEFDAYQMLVTQGQPVEAIAAKFGETVVHVQRRLKLANVAPELVDLYRQDQATLDQIMALAACDDQERQLLVWNSLSQYSRHPQTIKRKLIEEEVESTDVRVKVVGLDVYLKADGGVRTDLFSEEDTQYLTDPGLLDILLGEKLEEVAQTLRAEGWAWVEVLPSWGYEERQLFGSMPKAYSPETPEMQAEREALEASIQTLEDSLSDAYDSDEDGADEEISALEKKCEAANDRLEVILKSREIFDNSQGGAIVSIDHAGLVIQRGMIRKADQKSMALTGAEGGAGTSATSEVAPSRPDVPESLMRNLTSHRTAAIQAAMLNQQNVTLAALATKFAQSILGKYNQQSSPVKISLTESRSSLEKYAPTLAGSRAATELDSAREAWKARLPENANDWFDWFLNQGQDTVLGFLVFATANSIDAVKGQCGGKDDAAPIAKALHLDMSDYWKPTPASYFDLVPKAKLIAAVSEASGPEHAEAIAKMKKADAILHAVKHTENRRWLPQPLRMPEMETV